MREASTPLGRAHNYALMLLILLLPVQFSTNLNFRFAPSDIVLVLLVLFGGFRMTTSRDDWSVWHVLLLLLFSAGLLNSAFRYGEVTQWALVNKYVGILLLFLLYFLVVKYARSLDAIWSIARLVLVSIVLEATLSLPLYFVGLAYSPLHVDRIQGLTLDPNAYGGLVVMALALHWSTVNSPTRLLPSRLAWPVTLLLVGNLLFCFSRSSWIAFGFVAVGILILRPRARAHVFFPPAVAALIVLVFFRSYFAREIWPLVARPSQISGRFTILAHAWSAFLAHPLLGGGLGSYGQEYGVIVHNTFFWMLADMGIIGALIFVGFALVFAVRGFRAYRLVDREYRGLMASLLIAHFAMLGLSLGIEAFYQRSWWVIMALLNAGWIVVVRNRTEPAQSLAPVPITPAQEVRASPIVDAPSECSSE